MNTEETVLIALTKTQADDPTVRQEGLLEILHLCNEDVDHPWPYEYMADFAIAADPIEKWSTIMHYVLRYARIPDPTGAESKDQKYGEASNKCMKLGQILKEAGRHEEATQCFMWAARFAYSIEEDDSTVEQTWNIPIALAFECAEKADGEPRGDMSDEVHKLLAEMLDE